MNFIRNILDAVSNNLIAGDAYYLIAKSVILTLILTVIAWIIAFVLGGFISYFMCYEKKIVSALAKSFSFLFRSAPALLWILIFYYVFFQSSHISSFVIAALAIGLYGAGHFAEIIAHGVLNAQKRQNEQVTKRLKHMFYSVAFPQAMEETVFLSKRLAIHMFQWTAVVGYISVNDLTEIMIRIGQRTMYPFFSIFVCIVFYLFFTLIIECIFHMIERILKKNQPQEFV